MTSRSVPWLVVSNVRATALFLLTAFALALATPAVHAQTTQPFNVVPIKITSVSVQNGQLMANGLIGKTAFQTLITLTAQAAAGPSASAQPAAATCPVLDLSLAPIHLQLLGLAVDTSAICLDITAHQGGGLLGDLLCGIANLLNQGIPLNQILAGLTPTQLNRLDNGLTTLLNQAAFRPLSSSAAFAGAACNVLNLSLGPVDLNLLGLEVSLNNCAAGPVTLDITAIPGGGLLGDLLCGLAGGSVPLQVIAGFLHALLMGL